MVKKVLITGANSGFGYHTASKFAREGYYVFATTRRLESEGVTKLNDIAKQEDLKIEWLVLDVTNEEGIKNAIETVSSKGGLDVLVNNAGYGVIGPIEDYSLDDVKRQIDTNLYGVVGMIYAFLPLLKKSKKAAIINISSIAGLISAPAYGIYSASKWAVEAFTEALRYELHHTDIKVALVEPGGFNTKFSTNAVGLGKANGNNKTQASWFKKITAQRNEVIGNKLKKIRDPRKVSSLVYNLTQKSNPKLRNVIGYDAKAFCFFRRLLPARIWEWVVIKIIKK